MKNFRPCHLPIALVLLLHVVVQAHGADAPVKVFILAGQSNMEGKAKVSLLEHQINAPETAELFAHFHEDGKFVERDDVSIKFLDRTGPLTVGYGSPKCIGPELQFGHVVGDHYDEPVLLIKTAWGGKSLFVDFRPPSAGPLPEDFVQKQLENARKKKPETTEQEIEARCGHFYRQMIEEVKSALTERGEHFPQLKGRDVELAGFAWFQGFNDMINEQFVSAYTENMVHFIRDVRRDLEVPELPFVIGVLGVGGPEGTDARPNPKKEAFKKAQAAAGERPEFAGNVAVVHTDQFWDMEADAVFKKGWKENFEEWQKIGSDRPYHYLGSVKCYSRIGGALADALIELQKK